MKIILQIWNWLKSDNNNNNNNQFTDEQIERNW